MALERAILFIDGSNFFHAARHIGIATGELDYQKLADKLIMNRQLLSADGDFVPAVEAVKKLGKKVFAASPTPGYELGRVVDHFIPLRRDWFSSVFA